MSRVTGFSEVVVQQVTQEGTVGLLSCLSQPTQPAGNQVPLLRMKAARLGRLSETGRPLLKLNDVRPDDSGVSAYDAIAFC